MCGTRYDDVRLATLRDAPWNCCATLAVLAAASTPPAFGYANQYPLPPDCVRFNRIADNDDARWKVMGTMLMTDESGPLNVVYGRDLQDPTLFDPHLAQGIGYALALALAPSWRLDRARIMDIKALYDDTKRTAMFVGSQENSPEQFGEDVLLRARR